MDIQLYDTYIILDKFSVVILIVGPLTFLVFLLRGLRKRFTTVGTNIGLIVGLMLISYIFFRFAMIQAHYHSYVCQHVGHETLQDASGNQQKLKDYNEVVLPWVLFGICLAAIGFTGYKTYQRVATNK